jgi:transcription elongation GreA/GreB family factor
MRRSGFTPTEKKSILLAFVRQFESELNVLVESGKAAREAATHEESKAEDMHDTRGLEASYLAGAQAARAAELKQVVLEYRTLADQARASERVAAGAIVRVQPLDEDEEPKGPPIQAVIAVRGGGTHVEWEGEGFSVITPSSPLGEAALGAGSGEEIAVESKAGTKLYRIVGVY